MMTLQYEHSAVGKIEKNVFYCSGRDRNPARVTYQVGESVRQIEPGSELCVSIAFTVGQ